MEKTLEARAKSEKVRVCEMCLMEEEPAYQLPSSDGTKPFCLANRIKGAYASEEKAVPLGFKKEHYFCNYRPGYTDHLKPVDG